MDDGFGNNALGDDAFGHMTAFDMEDAFDPFENAITRGAHHVAAHVLPPVPEYYRKLTSFACSLSADHTFNALLSLLHSLEGCDLEYYTNSEFKGSILVNENSPCRFRIDLFDNTEQGNILVECSRQGGCAVTFQALFHEIQCMIAGETGSELEAPPARTFFPPILPSCSKEASQTTPFSMMPPTLVL
jgi:hypothetical protein